MLCRVLVLWDAIKWSRAGGREITCSNEKRETPDGTGCGSLWSLA